ncbi:DUF6455 family protein [Ruegeria arenilitoris]|uniref:DUF6455 family protein n=1 Tax=Ruegeria arenilitoris TaxID=1173585 RepID=UPI00266F5EB1|nr:DUF6455 family protein [Ruegeria arenilitoris]
MNVLGQTMKHVRLVLRMGQATGVDLVNAHRTGRLSPDEWARMVGRCRGCEWACDCSDWQTHRGDRVEAPETCPNRNRFAKLKTLQNQEKQ